MSSFGTAKQKRLKTNESPTEEKLFKIIQAPNYETRIFKHLSHHHWARFERAHHWKTNAREVDVFGDCWSLAWTDFNSDKVSVQTRRHKIYLNGPCIVWAPPHSIIDWRFRGGAIFWQAVLSNLRLPPTLPLRACIYNRESNLVLPNDLIEVEELLKYCTVREFIDKEESSSSVSKRCKDFMDRHWRESYSIEEISQRLGYNQSVMDRSFKSCYGLSPQQYRNRKRVLDSAHALILENAKVTDMALDVGFSGLENFSKQFKKLFRIPPSKFSQAT